MISSKQFELKEFSPIVNLLFDAPCKIYLDDSSAGYLSTMCRDNTSPAEKVSPDSRERPRRDILIDNELSNTF